MPSRAPWRPHLRLIHGRFSTTLPAATDPVKPMSDTNSTAQRRIYWPSVITVVSAAILIGAEVFGAAFAGGWALAILMGLDDTVRARHPGRAVRHRRRHHGGRSCAARSASSPSRGEADARERARARASEESLTSVHLHAALAQQSAPRLRKIRARRKKKLRSQFQKYYFLDCPISHVPVVVCRSVGIRTRGRTAAKEEKPERLSQETRHLKAPRSLQP